MTRKMATITEKINPVLQKYKVRKASIFGSFARGEEKKNSDIDILVELGEIGGLLAMAGLKRELEEATGRNIDLLTFRAIHPLLRKNIEKDQVKVYG